MLVVILLYRRITAVGKLAELLWVGVVLAIAWIIVAGVDVTSARRGPLIFLPEHSTSPEVLSPGWAPPCSLRPTTIGAITTFASWEERCSDPGRTIPRALIISIFAVAAIYIVMNISVLGVMPWRELTQYTEVHGGYVMSAFMQQIYGSWAGRAIAVLIIWTAFASIFSLLLGYSRVPYAAALDGNYFRAFATVHPKHRFPTVSLLALGSVAALFCLLRLADVIAALVVIRICLQFVVQAVGLIVFRVRRPDVPRPFRMWLYPIPALLAIAGFVFVLFARVNSMRELRYAIVITVLGILIYLRAILAEGRMALLSGAD